MPENNRREDRPDPDALLEEAAAEEGGSPSRGRLRIFFGASPGVGKTYAMLSEAQQLRRKGVDVVVGIVETHGREETMRLLQGLPRIPPLVVEYRGRTYQEFHLAAARERHPAVLLVDELAHTNLPGGVHEKRWQDVEDLLNAGIDVYTTLNVQHLESMSDIVAGVIKAPVRETVPDTLFQQAAEVILVDLPPDDLLQRLREGKVYVPEQAQRARQFFFRKGNLLALRQLALRATAERVDSQMLTFRTMIRSGGAGKGASESLLLCLGPRDRAPLVRAASRLAEALHARWHAVYVETPTLQRLTTEERSAILETLGLARELGARTGVLSGEDPVPEILDYARRHDLNRVVIGRGSHRSWRRWIPHRPFVRRIARRAPELDIVLLASARPEPATATRSPAREEASGWHRLSRRGVWKGYGVALLASLVATVLAGGAVAFFAWFHIRGLTFSNITMIYFFAVVAVAWRDGRGPAALAAVVNVVALDFFYGLFHRHVGEAGLQDVLTFAVLLGVGLLVGQLTARARYQTRVAGHRERRIRELYALARDLAAAVTEEQVALHGLRVLRTTFDARAVVILPETGGRLRVFGGEDEEAAPVELEIARWVLGRGEPAGLGTSTLAGAHSYYHPLRAKGEVRGVFVVQPRSQRRLRIPEERRQLDTYATLMASTLERLQLVASSQETLLEIQAERLRGSILAVLSHDLRTPLAAIVAGAEMLVAELPEGAARKHGRDVLDRAHALNRVIDDLLEMERLQGGAHLRRAWTSVDEILEVALREVDLNDHPLRTEIPEDCPELYVDPTLVRRVFVNLFQNVADHTPSGTPITVQARKREGECEIAVWDTGPGFVPGQEEAIFEKGVTASPDRRDGRFGIGLALSRAIVEAHGGTLRARNRLGGGAEFSLVFPTPAPAPAEVTLTEPSHPDTPTRDAHPAG